METLQKSTLVVTLIGAINWGLIGLFNLNLVSLLFGVDTVLSNLVYIIVGICGLIDITILFSHIEK